MRRFLLATLKKISCVFMASIILSTTLICTPAYAEDGMGHNETTKNETLEIKAYYCDDYFTATVYGDESSADMRIIAVEEPCVVGNIDGSYTVSRAVLLAEGDTITEEDVQVETGILRAYLSLTYTDAGTNFLGTNKIVTDFSGGWTILNTYHQLVLSDRKAWWNFRLSTKHTATISGNTFHHSGSALPDRSTLYGTSQITCQVDGGDEYVVECKVTID